LARCRLKKHKKVFVFKHFRGCVVPKVFKNKHNIDRGPRKCLNTNIILIVDSESVCF
jgi:hypothetical protein